MPVERRTDDFKGPKSLEEWIDVYERRAGDDVHFRLDDGEHIYYHPDHGFFTWLVCENHPGRISIPKMCGNGKILRRMVYELVKECTHLGIREVMCCSRHRPEVYMKRVLGGRFDRVTYTVNLNTGKLEPLYFYVISVDDYKGRDKE